MRYVRTLALLAVAAMAIVAFVGTGTASAAKFTAGASGKSIVTKQLKEHVFTVTGSEVKCNVIKFTGTTAGAEATEQSVAPTYEECKVGELKATVNTAGCIYTFGSSTTNMMADVTLSGCTNGGITILVSIPFIARCNIVVPNQTIPSAVTYSNIASSIAVTVTATGITAEVKESSGACPLTVGKHTTTTYWGEEKVGAEGTTLTYDDVARFTSSGAGATISTAKTKEHVFTVTGQETKCAVIKFTGTTAGAEAAEQSVAPTYEECIAGELKATVNTAGCIYTFKAATDAAMMATLNLSGCTNGGITILLSVPFIAKCHILIPNQSIASAATYTNTGSAPNTSVDVNTTASGITAEVKESTGACPLTVAKHTNATYLGEQTITAPGGFSHD